MRIRELHIERFGVWRELTLPLSPNGLNVLYGPNEAGKSTLLRFVRAVLYGFPEPDERAAASGSPGQSWAGELRVVHDSADWTIRRESRAGTRGVVTVAGPGGSHDAESVLSAMLAGTSQTVFEYVFAIGLAELQELATLAGPEVAEQIYGESLGPDGRRLQQAAANARQERQRLLDGEQHERGLAHLARRIAEVDREIGQTAGMTQQYAQRLDKRDRLQAEIADQQRRQAGLQQQLRGHLFLDRVWGPWSRQRKLMQQRDALPAFDGVPEDALARFDEIEQHITEHSSRRRELREHASRCRRDAAALASDAALARSAPVLRGLLSRRDELRALADARAARRNRLQADQRDLMERLEQLGPGWSTSRLVNDVDDSPDAAVKLLGAAQAYRSALRRRVRTIRRYRRLASLTQQQQLELTERLTTAGATSITDAKEQQRRRIANLEELIGLQSRRDAARDSGATLHSASGDRTSLPPLPPYFYPVLSTFGFAGLVVVLLGIIGAASGSIGHTPWMIGTIFTLLGVCLGGLTWTVKRHLEPQPDDGLRRQRAAADMQSQEREARVERLCRELEVDATQAGAELPELLVEAGRQLAELDEHSVQEQQQQAHRRQLSDMRQTLRALQREVSDARRAWCVALRECGLDESVRVKSSLARWQQLTEVRRLAQECADRYAEIERDELRVGEFETEVARLGEKIDGHADAFGPTKSQASRSLPPDAQARDGGGALSLALRVSASGEKTESAFDQLAAWERRLAAAEDARSKRHELRQAARRDCREAARARGSIRGLRQDRVSLLATAGVRDREGLLAANEDRLRRRELERQRVEVAAELESVARIEPELAVVEEDLLALDPEHNRQAIATIERELHDLSVDLQRSHEQLGCIRGEIAELESNRRPAVLRFQRAQLIAEFEGSLQQLAAVELAARALGDLQDRLERDSQPQTLRHAATDLQRLTCGRYGRIWRPLGEHRLLVDDDRGQSLAVDNLSNGTREQLLLALRLALLRGFAERGVELPMVLDDVFVNFDQVRTEAAVRVLIDFAAGGAGGQVLFFTCHLHLAQLFEALGAQTLWLPGHVPELEYRRAG